MAEMPKSTALRLALPKGRMQKAVFCLLGEAGLSISATARRYRPEVSLKEFKAKILKPQNIIEMVQAGSCDLGFAGADWVSELQADVVELLDTGLDPVTLVAAAPEGFLENGKLPTQSLVVASEYENLSKSWIKKNNLQATLLKSYGATEVFPPEDADFVIDITQTGATLRANNLQIVGEIIYSSTRLYANPETLENNAKRLIIENFVTLIGSVIEARKRVMVELNVSSENLENVVSILPCMREATVSPLYGDAGFAVKAAVPRKELPRTIPQVKAAGGEDIVVSTLSQIVP